MAMLVSQINSKWGGVLPAAIRFIFVGEALLFGFLTCLKNFPSMILVTDLLSISISVFKPLMLFLIKVFPKDLLSILSEWIVLM